MEPPFAFRARHRFILCGRELLPGDRVTVYPGFGVYPVLNVPPDYMAVAEAFGNDALEPITPSLSAASFAQAVGLEPVAAPGKRERRSRRAWGRRLHRERAGLALHR